MSGLLDLFWGDSSSSSRKRKREETASTVADQRERKNRRTEIEDQAPQEGFFQRNVMNPIRTLFSSFTSQPAEVLKPQEVAEEPLRRTIQPASFRMPPKMLRSEASVPATPQPPFSLPNRERQSPPLVEASPFVPPSFSYQVKGTPSSEKRTPTQRNIEPRRETPIYTSPFRFSTAPLHREPMAPTTKVNRTSPSPVRSLSRPSPSPNNSRKTHLEQIEESEEKAKWNSVLSTINDSYEQQPQQKILREQQEKYRNRQAQKAGAKGVEDLSFEYTEEKPVRRTLPIKDHDYERALEQEKRRNREKVAKLQEQFSQPIAWPKLPSPTDFYLPQDRDDFERYDYGLRSLYKADESDDWEEEEREEESEEFESVDEESEVSPTEERRRRGMVRYEKLSTLRGGYLGEDYNESDLEVEFYDAKVDDVDLEAIKKGERYRRVAWTVLAEQKMHMRAYDGSVGERHEQILQARKLLRKIAKQEKKELKRRFEEQRRREEEERRKQHTFSKEEAAVIQKALKGRDGEVVISGFNTDLKKSDIRRLRDTEWLNDEVINFYLELLKERNTTLGTSAPKCHFFNTFFYPLLMDNGKYNYPRVRGWTRRVDIFAMEKVVVPVHMGNHWCLAVINFKDKRFEYYDSLGSSNNPCMKTLRRYLADESMDKKKTAYDLSDWQDYQPKDIPLQKNGYDCGVFMCKYADCVSAGRPFLFKQMHMPYFRQLMILEIVQKRCSPISF